MRTALALLLACLSFLPADAQPADPEEPAWAKSLPLNEMELWESGFERAPTKQARLSLLREAWSKSQDARLTEWEREKWRAAWLRVFEKEARRTAIEDAMPNPYAH